MPRWRLDARGAAAVLDRPGLAAIRATIAAVSGVGDVDDLIDRAADEPWSAVREIGDRHKMIPLVAFAAERGLIPTGALSDEVCDRLALCRRRVVGRVLRLVGETLEVQSALEATGVRSIVVKGPALSTLLHGDLAARGAGDIDLVVDALEVGTAEAVLARRGYVRTRPWVTSAGPAPIRSPQYHSVTLVGVAATIDLHWRLDPFVDLVPPPLGPTLDRRIATSIAGDEIWTLPPDDLVYAASAHAVRSVRMRLKWLADHGAIWADADGALRVRAHADGLRRGLATADEVLGAVTGTGAVRGLVASQVLLALDRPQDDPASRRASRAMRVGHAGSPREVARMALRFGTRGLVGPLESSRNRRVRPFLAPRAAVGPSDR